MTAPLTVLQITDSHLKDPSRPAPRTLLGVDTAESLRAVLKQALGEQLPDAVIASGDLAQDPEDATYRRFRTLLGERFGGPVLHVPGNHDLATPMGRVLGGGRSLVLAGWELIGFDTHADDQVEASFDDAGRRALAARIQASEAHHVLLVCHHHPWPVGCPWLDKDCIPDGRALLESCAALPGKVSGTPVVRGLVFGHVHQEVRAALGGLCVLGTPSTCFQFQPHSPRFTIDGSEDTGRPGYRWLVLHADGAVESQVGRIDGHPLNIDLSDRS